MANALKAGLLPFLERTLRHGYRELAARAGQPDPRVASVLSQTLLQPRKDWGWLLAYGDPHQVARLMRTCAQLLRQHVEQREADRCGWAFAQLLHACTPWNCREERAPLHVGRGIPAAECRQVQLDLKAGCCSRRQHSGF